MAARIAAEDELPFEWVCLRVVRAPAEERLTLVLLDLLARLVWLVSFVLVFKIAAGRVCKSWGNSGFRFPSTLNRESERNEQNGQLLVRRRKFFRSEIYELHLPFCGTCRRFGRFGVFTAGCTVAL